MGRNYIPVPPEMIKFQTISIFAAAISAVGLAAVGRAAETKNSGVVPDVLIQAEQNRPVEREKPPLEVNLKEDAPLEPDLQLEDEVRHKLPSDIEKAKTFAPGQSNSSQPPVPATNWIVLASQGEPARVFFPLRELQSVYPSAASKEDKNKSTWEFVVIDDSGKVFKRFAGTGLPPERLDFDGRSDDGEWLKVGQVYTGLLTFRDSTARAHTAMGKPFALAGLITQGPRGPVISLAPKMLFEPGSTSVQLSASGKDLLREAAQLIQRFYPGLSLKVAANLSKRESSWVESAADVCAKDLAKRLALLPSAVGASAHPATPDLEERVDVTVVNR